MFRIWVCSKRRLPKPDWFHKISLSYFFFDGCGPEKVHHSIPQGSQLMFRQETLEIKKSKPRAMRLDFGLVGVPCKVPPKKKTKLVSRTHRTMGFIDVYSKYIMIYTYVYTYLCFFSQDLFRVFVLRRYILGDTAKGIRQAAYEVPCRNHGSHGTDKENEDLLCFKHGD